MTETNINPQEMLDQILAMGRDLLEEGKTKAGPLKEKGKELSVKGKELAAKGEDFLAEKLDIEDNEVARDALRKGVGAGAAAGALALLLSSRSGRNMAKIGGLGALGVLAYKAYKSGKMPTSADDVIGLIKGPAANVRADILIRAMIAAAKADGDLNDGEMALIRDYDGASVDVLKAAMSEPTDAKSIAALADTDQAAAEIYAVSCRVANGLNPKERDYLDRLAMALRMDPEMAARIETDMRTG